MSLIEARERVPAPPEQVFDFLSALDHHWQLADRWIEVVNLESGPGADPGAPPDRGTVRMRGPLGLSRTARTRVLHAERPRALRGSAEVGHGTVARVAWDLDEVDGGTEVRLSAEVEAAGPLDRVLMAIGGRQWMRRRFRAVLRGLAERLPYAAGIERQPALVRA